MKSASSLTNQLLIAMPDLEDPYFYQSVTLICEHNEKGAMGIVINQPTEIPFAELLTQLEIDYSSEFAAPSVLMGGPVHEQAGFILHSSEGEWESSLRINEQVCLTSSKDILSAMGVGKGPKKANLLLGYAGWGAGQLEQEIMSNSWLTAPVSSEILFDIPMENRWSAAAKSIGVNISRLSSETGHA
jgi:putative transcriptional regulator